MTAERAPSQQVSLSAALLAELRWLTLSSLVICCNWGIYIWAVANHRVIEASMGYFLTPLLNVLAGVIVFREKLSALEARRNSVCRGWCRLLRSYHCHRPLGGDRGWDQLCRIWAAAQTNEDQCGARAVRRNPVIAAIYPGAAVMAALFRDKRCSCTMDWNTDMLLILGGPITIIPLAFFTAGTRMLPLTTVGILFYVTPSLQFLSGVLLLGEAFQPRQADRLYRYLDRAGDLQLQPAATQTRCSMTSPAHFPRHIPRR